MVPSTHRQECNMTRSKLSALATRMTREISGVHGLVKRADFFA